MAEEGEEDVVVPRVRNLTGDRAAVWWSGDGNKVAVEVELDGEASQDQGGGKGGGVGCGGGLARASPFYRGARGRRKPRKAVRWR
jgi:hypothetical protein